MAKPKKTSPETTQTAEVEQTTPSAEQLSSIVRGDDLSIQTADDCDDAGLMSHDDTVQQVASDTINESDMTADFVIVTRRDDETTNRNGNIVQLTKNKLGPGMVLDNYRLNPLVLLNHGHRYPHAIGLATDRAKTNNRLRLQLTKTQAVSTCYFRQDDPWAEFVFASVAGHYMRMASVGYRAHAALPLQRRSDRQSEESPVCKFEDHRRYWDFVHTELYEWSIVDIGADRGAFRQSLDQGRVGQFKLTAANDCIRQYVSGLAEPRPAWSPGVDLSSLQQQGMETLKELGVEVNGDNDSVTQLLELVGGVQSPDSESQSTSGMQPGDQKTEESSQVATQTFDENELGFVKTAIEQSVASTVADLTAPLIQSVDNVNRQLDYLQGVTTN